MKKIFVFILLFFLLSFFSAAQLSAQGDKLKHFGVSLLFGAAGESVLHYSTDINGGQKVLFGTLLGTVPGLLKEWVDSTREGNRFSGGDLAADFLGSFCGALLSYAVNNKIQVRVNLDKKRQLLRVSVLYTF